MNDNNLPSKPPWVDPQPVPPVRDDVPRKSDFCACWPHRAYQVMCEPRCEAYEKLRRIHTAELGRGNTTMLERIKPE